jgi:NEDD4-binding protein 2
MNSGVNGTLFIMRGLPGSGKSTLAKSLGGVVFSTDDFFMVDGEYQFDFEKLGLNHALNRKRTEEAMRNRIPVIVVDNTNTTAREIKPYVQLADEYGYRVELKMPETPWMWDLAILVEKNTHKVPMESLQAMKARFQHDLTLEKIRESGHATLQQQESEIRLRNSLSQPLTQSA